MAVMGALIRKGRQLVGDPVLRRYLIDRVLGRMARPPVFRPHHPPYLDDAAPDGPAPDGPALRHPPVTGDCPPPTRALTIRWHETDHVVPADDPGALFRGPFADGETAEAMQRFAFLPLDPPEPGWLAALWGAWKDQCAPRDGLAWDAYSAAERVCNLLDHGRRFGLPGGDQMVADLAAHGPRILAGLEYWGEHGTHNHLANDGRGLFRLGTELGLPNLARAGLTILLAEARRIITPGGVMREGSSHYHLLYVRNYADCWLTALRHDDPSAIQLEAITARLLAASPVFAMPGRFPLMGDISPDSPPEWLAGLLPGGPMTGWLASLEAPLARRLMDLRDRMAAQPACLDDQGWVRRDAGGWSLLAHVEPRGWPFYPGHAHQDLGGFELHWQDLPVIVDAGRGAYGESGDAALYRSALVHNGLLVADQDPYPPNKPYYDDAFRVRVAGPAPDLDLAAHGFALTLPSLAAQGLDRAARSIRLDPQEVIISDQGVVRHPLTLVRRLHTPLCPVWRDDGLILGGRLRLSAECGGATIASRPFWTAYGRSVPGWVITLSQALPSGPWQGFWKIEVL